MFCCLSLMTMTPEALEERPLHHLVSHAPLSTLSFLAMMLAEAWRLACWAVMGTGCAAGLPLLSSKQAGPLFCAFSPLPSDANSVAGCARLPAARLSHVRRHWMYQSGLLFWGCLLLNVCCMEVAKLLQRSWVPNALCLPWQHRRLGQRCCQRCWYKP